MEYRLLGKSDLLISRIGFGAMSLELENPISQMLLQEALTAGINYFDTADLYHQGLNESLLGRVLKGKRKEVILATKVGNQWRTDGSGWDWVPSKKYILSAAEKSLQRLQTDYIDFYQLHGGTIDDPIDEILEAFDLLKMQGKIRAYGISSIRPQVIREYIKRSSIAGVMMQYSLLDRRPEEEMLSLLQHHQIGVLARGSLAQGLLISKPPESFLNYSAAQVGLASSAINAISNKDRTASATAIQFVLQNPAISSAVVGIRTKNQLMEAINVGSINTISLSERQQLSNILPRNDYKDFR